MKRGDLLIIAERATELLPRAKLQEVFGDRLRLHALTKTAQGRVGLLEEVRKFHDASLRGDYYESFDVDSKNFMQMSLGTEVFIAEFDRLVRKCIRAAEKGPRAPVRAPFELLFALLGHIDSILLRVHAATGHRNRREGTHETARELHRTPCTR